jgi:hypothetical protein
MRIFAALVLLLSGTVALAQSAGGYSAGPAQAAPTYVAVPDGGVSAEAASRDDNGVDYATRVTSYVPSPTYTQNREFTNARLWVLDPGRYTVEQWWTGSFGAPRADPNAYPDGSLFQTEIEMGIAPHVQVDIYANYEFGQNADEGGAYEIVKGGHTGIAAEVRVALGNYWGQIWGNPTLYFELTSQYYNSPRAEFRLLLGGTVFTPKLLAAFNFAFERNIFRDSSSGIDYEIKGDFGINYEIVHNICRVGLEATLGFDSHGSLDASGASVLHYVAQFGPSLLLTDPKGRVKLLAAVLHGFAAWDQPWVVTTIIGFSW